MDDSKFNLWRATFSFCFIDGFLDESEQQWMHAKLDSLPFTKEQASTLLKDFKSPPDIDRLLPLITRPADKGFLINHMRLIANIDSRLSNEEKTKIQTVQKAVMSKIDVNALNDQLSKDTEQSKVHDKKSYVESVIGDLSKFDL